MEKSSKKILVKPVITLLNVYKLCISPFLAGGCRYQPTCSEYAKEAIQNRGLLKGSLLTLHRLGRCHPFGGEGYDPVPEKHQCSRKEQTTNVYLKS